MVFAVSYLYPGIAILVWVSWACSSLSSDVVSRRCHCHRRRRHKGGHKCSIAEASQYASFCI